MAIPRATDTGNVVAERGSGARRRLRHVVELPPVVTGVTTQVDSPRQITVSWTHDITGKTDGYVVQRSADAETFVTIAIVEGELSESYTDTGLTGSTTYYYRVLPYDAQHTSLEAEPVEETTDPTVFSGGTVESISLTNVSRTVLAPLVDGYTIDRAALGLGTFNVVVVGSTGTQSVEFVLTGPTPISRYENSPPYTMAAEPAGWTPDAGDYNLTVTLWTLPDKGGLPSTPLVIDMNCLALSLPSAPTIIGAETATSDAIIVTWNDNSDNETTFQVDCAKDAAFTVGLRTIQAPANIESAVATGLDEETEYFARVRAVNPAGSSVNSGTASATTLSAPQGGDRPGAANTGYTGVLVPLTGSLNITAARAASLAASVSWGGGGSGTVGDKWRIRNFSASNLNIRCDNVELDNGLITGGTYGIECYSQNGAGTGIVLKNLEIRGSGSAGVWGDNYTAQNCNVWDMGRDAFKSEGNTVIEDCWIHHIGYVAGAHADGVQVVQGNNHTIRRNYFDMGSEQTAYISSQLIIIQTNFTTISGIVIEENWFNGGGIMIQINNKFLTGGGNPVDYGPPLNITLRNNRFGRDYDFGLYGQTDDVILSVIGGNVWDDTGVLVGSGVGDTTDYGIN